MATLVPGCPIGFGYDLESGLSVFFQNAPLFQKNGICYVNTPCNFRYIGFWVSRSCCPYGRLA